ncbi:probable calcium-binding protein CML18 isoform X2 [Salvia miltiorrhiza]|nr:probable calcium-binding protein CML18 isoform X2 [Salvia miltiorrhiza]
MNFSRKPTIFKKVETSGRGWRLTFAAMEASSQLKQVFKLMDADGDGKLSPSELRRVLLSLGHERGEAAREAEGIVREMDRDGDGLVDLDEFMVVVGSDDDGDGDGDGDGKGVSRESVMMGAFGVFDANGDGLISAEELRSVLARLGCGRCSGRECRKMIEGVDRDGDGFVSFEEFKVMMNAGYY